MLSKGDITANRVAISGGLCAGKTLAAGYLMGHWQYELLGFATPLYKLAEIHAKYTGTLRDYKVREWITENIVPLNEYGMYALTVLANRIIEVFDKHEPVRGKNRTLLQELGTEVGREFDENLWVKLFERALSDRGPDARVVNDNLRFPNEIDSCERTGFVKVYLDVDPEVQAERYLKTYGVPIETVNAHKSEAYLGLARERADYVFDNSSKLTSPLFAFLEDVVIRAV